MLWAQSMGYSICKALGLTDNGQVLMPANFTVRPDLDQVEPVAKT